MTEVNYNGKEELLMADYEGISDSDLTSKYANTDFDITDAPSTYITNDQMTYALTCKRLFPAGDTYICNDEGTYKKGHTYTIKVDGETKSWEDVTPTPTIDDTPTATSNNPVKSSGIYTAIQGKQDKLTAGANILIQNNVISSTVPPTKVDNQTVSKNASDELQAIALKNKAVDISSGSVVYKDFKGVMILTEAQYNTLYSTGTLEVDGVVFTYDPAMIYETSDGLILADGLTNGVDTVMFSQVKEGLTIERS